MFRFENPEYLYALALIPMLAVFFAVARYARKRAILRFGEHRLMLKLMPETSRYKDTVKFILLMFALSFLVIGWANPQWGTKKEKVRRKGVDVFLALDISLSMLAKDIPPNRMERAKKFAQTLVEELKGERIGLIIFAGNAYLQMPLTTDYAAAQLFLRTANPDLAPTQGTAIGDAIQLAERSFEEDAQNHKALIIISDGENHEPEALQKATEANKNGLLILTVGVGTAKGGFIPVQYGSREDYKRDQSGNPVRTKLNEEMLKNLAKAGGGAYFNITQGDKVAKALQKRIDKLEKREFEMRAFEKFESYFQYFIATGLLLIVVEFMLSYRKSKWLKGKHLFN